MLKIERKDITGGHTAPATTIPLFTKQLGKRKDWTIPAYFDGVQCKYLPLLAKDLLKVAPTLRDALLDHLDFQGEHESAASLRSRKGLPHGGLENLFLNLYPTAKLLEEEEITSEFDYPTSSGVETHRDDHASHGAVILSLTDDEGTGQLYTASFLNGKRISIRLGAGDAAVLSRSDPHGVELAKRDRSRLVVGFFF
jgi:hypothetical protein